MNDYILLVDSNVKLAEKLKISLEKDGFNITTANNHEAAMQQIESIKPQLIISELLLDDINGLDFLNQIKNSDHYSTVPFMFLTAANDLVVENRAWRVGVDDYHNKQIIKKQDLIKSINRLINTDDKGEYSATNNIKNDLTGNLEQIKLSDIIKFIHQQKYTGLLQLNYSGRVAELGLHNGEIFYSILENFQGVDVIEEIIKLRNGQFQFELTEIEIDNQNMDQSTQTIIKLLEN